ncbi:MAG: hypothetical protein HYU64_19275 [Armatimonadetes bacterium]|nr:hypothetical protein [Armatimonadota bacterium]
MEFFLTPDSHFVAIEINVRPPGGFSLDMMNFACDIDLCQWWAKLIAQNLDTPIYERKYHSAHACRRKGWHYRFDHNELLRRLGNTLAVHVHIPPAFSVAMGDEAYILRHPDLGALKEAIAWVEETA